MSDAEAEAEALAQAAYLALTKREDNWHDTLSDYCVVMAGMIGGGILLEGKYELLSLKHARIMAMLGFHFADLANGSKSALPNAPKVSSRPPRGIALEMPVARLTAKIGLALQKPIMRGLSQEEKYRLIAANISKSDQKISWKQVRSIWANRNRLSQFGRLRVESLTEAELNRSVIETVLPEKR